MDLTAWSGPCGVSCAIDLTPDEDTGIGVWTEDDLVNAIRAGKHMGADHPILPPMPWQDYAHLAEDDLGTVLAFLRTCLPSRTTSPTP